MYEFKKTIRDLEVSDFECLRSFEFNHLTHTCGPGLN